VAKLLRGAKLKKKYLNRLKMVVVELPFELADYLIIYLIKKQYLSEEKNELMLLELTH